jgi:hypothetical protein
VSTFLALAGKILVAAVGEADKDKRFSPQAEPIDDQK